VCLIIIYLCVVFSKKLNCNSNNNNSNSSNNNNNKQLDTQLRLS